MSSTVTLVMQLKSVVALEAIARCMPVWVAETEGQLLYKAALCSKSVPLTWFPLRGGETLEQAAARISYSLDDHYNEGASSNPYKFLLVYGVNCDEAMQDLLDGIGFKVFEETDFGFVAEKR